MQIAGVDLYVNHPVLALGSTEWIPSTLALGDAPAAGCGTHVIVRVQAQTALIRVRLFTDHGDRGDHEGARDPVTTVFDGDLLLNDGRLVIGDVVGESRFTTSLLGTPGRRRVQVLVDVPQGQSRAVDIVISAGAA
ncbi:hypothetical protein [Streptomyces cyaneofuscatus]|uniref:hypothetical protein n=1 Tax=Streptomyces cyaneofuscatus TaxID=66883 RepID=UPI00380B8433